APSTQQRSPVADGDSTVFSFNRVWQDRAMRPSEVGFAILKTDQTRQKLTGLVTDIPYLLA
ncbi:MAG: hypothetical protein AAF991_05250, partial [Pseudomonadota bacterium]